MAGADVRIAAARRAERAALRDPERLVRVARLARSALNAAVAGITIEAGERQPLVAADGIDATPGGRAPAVLRELGPLLIATPDEPLTVEDLRTSDGPQNGHVVLASYAGAAIAIGGQPVGTLFVADPVARAWSERDRELITGLARLAETELALQSDRMRGDLSARTAELVVRATEMIGAPSEHPYERLERLARLAVPDLADLCIIDVAGDDAIRPAAVAASDPEVADSLRAVRTRAPLDPGGEHPVARVLRSGEVELLPDLRPGALAGMASGDEHLEFMVARHYRSAIVVPLRIGGATAGVLSVLRVGEEADSYGPEELEAVLALAGHAGVVLERAFAYDREQIARRVAVAAATRAQFLAEATTILESSLGERERLDALARLAVPQVADWCGIELVDERGELVSVATAHADPDRIAHAVALRERYAPDPAEPGGPYQVIRSGEALFYPEVTDAMLAESARDPEHLDLIRALGLRSVMLLPLSARGETYGVLTLVAAETIPSYTDSDFEFAKDLANRAGLAIDNARLYQRQITISRTLQSSLLPRELPAIEGIELAASYAAAADDCEVGGDFYDVFATGPRRWTIVIGDVCGKGPAAAALTSLVRHTLRAIAPDKPGSMRVRAINDALRRETEPGYFATLVHAELELRPTGPQLMLVTAGHPPPLLLAADGRSRPIGHPGPALNIGLDEGWEPYALSLHPGDALLFYTDGLTESNPERVAEPAELAAALSREPVTSAPALIERTLALQARATAQARDDTALLALRIQG